MRRTTDLGKFNPSRGLFHSWLRKLVRNKVVSGYRSSHRLRDNVIGVEHVSADSTSDPAELCESAEAREQLAAAITVLGNRLSDRDYQIFHDHFFEGKSYGGIGLVFGMTGEQVRERCRRAVRKLRGILLNEVQGPVGGGDTGATTHVAHSG